MKKLLLILLCLPIVACASFIFPEGKTNLNNDSCDNIMLQNSETISAKVIEITFDYIKYKKCTNQDGPTISIHKNEVILLTYYDESKNENPLEYHERGDSKQEGGDAYGAIADYTQAIKLTEESGSELIYTVLEQHYWRRGNSYFSIKQYENAITDYTKSIDISPMYQAFINRGLAKLKLGYINSGCEDFKTGKRKCMSNGEDYSDVQELIDLHCFPISKDHQNFIDKVNQLHRDGEALIHRDGKPDYSQQRISEAITKFTMAIEINEAYKGDNEHSKKIHKEMKAVFGYTCRNLPLLAESYFLRGVVKSRFGDNVFGNATKNEYIDAIEDFSKAIQIGGLEQTLTGKEMFKDGKVRSAYMNRGYAKFNIDDFDGAISDCTKSIELSPNPFAYLLRGFCKYRLGELEEACKDLKELILIDKMNKYDGKEFFKKVCN